MEPMTHPMEAEKLIERAIETETPISFRYWRDGDFDAPPREEGAELPTRRTVSPYELRDGKDGKTLLLCWSHGSEGVRAFDIDRIGGVRSEADAEEFVRPVSA